MAGFSMDVQEGCAPLQVQFSAESQGQVDSLWWDFGGGTPQQSSEPMPLVRFDQAGIYYVNLSVQNAWGTSVAEDSLIVLAQPESAFDYDISGNTVDFTSTSSGGNLSHDWRFGDGNTSSIANPRHIYDSAGVFRVQLIVGNSCGLDTLMREVDLRTVRTSGPVAAGPAVRLFPNPSPGVVWLEMSGWVGEEVRLSLVSALGQVVQVQRIPAWGGGVLREQLDWSRLPTGLYVIRLESGKQRWQGELLISD
jgi:PKD repeat protein